MGVPWATRHRSCSAGEEGWEHLRCDLAAEGSVGCVRPQPSWNLSAPGASFDRGLCVCVLGVPDGRQAADS